MSSFAHGHELTQERLAALGRQLSVDSINWGRSARGEPWVSVERWGERTSESIPNTFVFSDVVKAARKAAVRLLRNQFRRDATILDTLTAHLSNIEWCGTATGAERYGDRDAVRMPACPQCRGIYPQAIDIGPACVPDDWFGHTPTCSLRASIDLLQDILNPEAPKEKTPCASIETETPAP